MRALLSSLVLAFAAAAPAAAQSYTYDADGRLVQVTYSDGTTIATTYDAAGNVLSSSVTPTPPAGGGGGGGGGGGCFIATAAFGSELHPHVATLRAFRDERLLTNAPGRALVDLYYASSPPAASAIADSELLRAVARSLLVPLVYAVAYPAPFAAAALLLLALSAWRLRRARYAPSTTQSL